MYGSSGYTLVRIYDAPGCTNLIKSIVSKDKLLELENSLAVLQFAHRGQFGSPAVFTLS